jgi:formylglycine-generating enzyme required for sulfatase activity
VQPIEAEPRHRAMTWIEGGPFRMGSDRHYPEERPAHEVSVDGFWIDEHPVTNVEYAGFVDATGHVTLAETAPKAEDYPGALPEMLFAGSLVFQQPSSAIPLDDLTRWWDFVEDACWRAPAGPLGMTVDGARGDLADHPVVHVAYADALAYAQWAGKDLPTEAEWEYAARGGLDGKLFPWGDELEPGGEHRMNVWQGAFPAENSVADGFYGTCPVDEFPPNGFGLHNMTGNVWEWCANWFHPDFHTRDTRTNPQGPPGGANRSTRGGSYLCHRSYCARYRVAARNSLTPDSTTGNTGFRCVRDSQ